MNKKKNEISASPLVIKRPEAVERNWISPPKIMNTNQQQSNNYASPLKAARCLTVLFNVDRADQLDCRRWRDNIKKAVRNTLRGGDKMNSSNSNNHVLENIGFLMCLNAHE